MKKGVRLKRLWTLVEPYRTALWLGLLCISVVTAVDLALPLFFGRGVVDQTLMADGELRQLGLLALIGIGLVALKGLFSFGQVYLLSYVGQRSLHTLRADLFAHLMRLPVSYFQRTGPSEIVSRATHDIGVLQNALGAGIADLVQQTLLLVGIIGAIFWMNWKLALVTLVVLPASAWAVSNYGERIRRQSKRLNERIGRLTTLLNESIAGIRVVKAYTMEEAQRERFHRENERGFQASMKAVQASATMQPVVELIMVIGMMVVIGVGSVEVIQDRLTMGDLVAFLAYVAMAARPVGLITRTAVLLQQATAAADRVFQLLEEGREVPQVHDARPLPAVAGRITFRNVRFAYDPGGPEVLHGIDLEVAPGETVALVGPSGAGKSTLAALVPRFFDPTEGTVEIDGIDVRRVTLASLRRQIGLVPQDTVLFSGTVEENILAGRQGFTRKDVEEAARQANAHEFIVRLPQGYETVLGEGGLSLSGGQRQRLAIARALLGDPRILIFDEATSNLDNESESLVQEAFRRLKRGRTSIIIAHRAATIRLADRVVVMAGGRIVQDGRHAELLAQPGLYRRLFAELEAEDGWQPEAASI